MQKSQVIVETVKKTIKSRGWTYSRLAAALQVSEPSMKRLFSGKGNLTLDRLEKICDVVGVDMITIMQNSRVEATQPKVSYEQEVELAKDIKRLIFFTSLRKGYGVEKTLQLYRISKKEKDLYLKQLEELGLLERHAADRVKLLVDRSVHWIADGPVRKLYLADMKKTYLDSDFKTENEFCHFVTLHLTSESMDVLNRKIEKLIKDFQELNQLEHDIEYNKKNVTTLLLANRSWIPSQALEYLR